MKTLVICGAMLAIVPSAAYAQNSEDWLRFGLQAIQEIDRAQRNNNNNYRPPQNNGGQQQYQYRSGSGPNASGNQNQGNFTPNGFFGPQNGVQPGRINYPNNTYPNTRPYPNNTYPSNRYPNYTRPSGTVYRPRPSYSEPPSAPRKTYSRLPILIRCAPDAIGTCSYELVTASGKSFPYQIHAGQTQNLVESTDWLIRYRPAPGAPSKTYRLRGGRTYEIQKIGNEWQCYLTP